MAIAKVTDWLQENQTAIIIFSPVGATLCGLGVRFAPTHAWTVLFVVLLTLFAAAPAAVARVNRLQQGRRAAEQCLKRLLHACGQSFGYPGQHIRVNIMRFSADMQRRKVDAATAFNMDRDPDVDLENRRYRWRERPGGSASAPRVR